jgi:hypothetical protein
MKKEQQNKALATMHLEEQPLVYLHEHFKKQKISALKNNWVWYSKEDLQNVIKAIEQIEKDEPEKKGDGVRLYMAIYNNRLCDFLTAISTTNPKTDYIDHEGHNTIFILPTYEGSNKDEHIDCISKANVIKYKKEYDNDHPIPVPHPWTGGFDVGTICPPPTDCSGQGSNF